jgi:hypothetical protein
VRKCASKLAHRTRLKTAADDRLNPKSLALFLLSEPAQYIFSHEFLDHIVWNAKLSANWPDRRLHHFVYIREQLLIRLQLCNHFVSALASNKLASSLSKKNDGLENLVFLSL